MDEQVAANEALHHVWCPTKQEDQHSNLDLELSTLLEDVVDILFGLLDKSCNNRG